jgi:hypothetical protein
MTTLTTLPETKYRRLDMAQLPPYKLVPDTEMKKRKPVQDHMVSPLRYRNIWDDETEAKLVADKEKADLARLSSRKTQTKSTKMRRPFCKFCWQRGFPLAVCKTHYTKSGPEFGAKITCPALLQQQCARCGEMGHTPKYCRSEFWLKTNPCQISPYRNPLDMDWFNLVMIDKGRESLWQKPIPPALQKRHEEYDKKYVKTSRIWIEMTGDHKHYTNDFRIVMMVRNKDDWFDVTPRTEYEDRVQKHYEWMRKVMWDETPQRSCDKFFIVNSPPPSYEEATAAAELTTTMTEDAEKTTTDDTTTTAAEAAVLTEAKERTSEWFQTAFQRQCKQVMSDIVKQYLEHQTK